MKTSEMIYVIIGLSFIMYFLITFLYKTLRINNLSQAIPKIKGLPLLDIKHFIGIVLFGILSYGAFPEFRYLITDITVPRLYVLIPFFIVVFLSVNISVSSARKSQSNDFEIDHLPHTGVIIYFVIRLLFLISYEFFFRGVLFYSFLNSNSLSISIFYTTLLYVIIHIFDSKKEIIGAVPFGIVLCLFTYYTNNVWFAFIIHAALSLAYEISTVSNLTFKTQKS